VSRFSTEVLLASNDAVAGRRVSGLQVLWDLRLWDPHTGRRSLIDTSHNSPEIVPFSSRCYSSSDFFHPRVVLTHSPEAVPSSTHLNSPRTPCSGNGGMACGVRRTPLPTMFNRG